MFKSYIVYIITNKNKSTLYIGVTSNIQKRLSQHYFDSENAKKSFTANTTVITYYIIKFLKMLILQF